MAAESRRSDLDAEVQQLYARPLTEFTTARNDLAKRLQKEGKTDDASEVKSLAKPTASAWAVNRLFQEERERMDALLAAGAKARNALQHTLAHGEAEALREALQQERTLRDDLRRRAGKLLGRAGQAILDRVGANLDALALSPAAAEAAERGWLDRDLDPPGFEVLSGMPLPGAPRDRRGLRLVPPAQEEKERARGRRQEETVRKREEKAAATRREKEAARLREELARVEEKAEQASAEELSAHLDAERAEKEAAEAEKAAAEATRRAEAAREAAERALQRAERASRELERAKGHVEAARRRLPSGGD